MNSNSNRLFSEFLSLEELNQVNFYGYFACLRKDNAISLLPTDHCLYYPLSFDVATKQIHQGELNFFNKVLHENYKTGNPIEEKKFSISNTPKKRDQAILVNLIDNCYGHSFLKLLNLFNIYEKYGDKNDIWVLCPSAIKHFVPTDKFFMAGVSIGFNEAMKCGSMDYLLERLRKTYTKLDFVTLDTYSVYENKNSINAFFPFIDPSVNATKQYITFYYRSDYFRTWNGAKQHKLIAGFFDQLRPYFNSSLQFVVVGDKDGFTFPETVIDKRTNAFGKTVDQEYNAIFMKSCFVIGLIGSNMLQPAMFCDFTIHLVPRSKTTIVAEEFFNVNEAAIQNWFNNIYLFGNENLSDLKSGHLVEKTVLLFLTYLAKLYKKDIYTDDYFANRISQVDYLKKNYPYFNLEKAQALKQLVTDESFNYNLKRFRILKALRILRIIKS